ncbi:MAG: sulfatase-like hydrolase/transferase [Tepidisphaeraceae bacterium]|jgi:phosphoglycerol transferase MdoB-like AlkP superfamily enzyme
MILRRCPHTLPLVLIALLLLVPKLALWSYMQHGIPADFGRPELGRSVLQDVALSIAAFVCLYWFTRTMSWVRAVVGFAATILLLGALLFDIRVRELWARPLGWDLVHYYQKYASDLADGAPAFWVYDAGLGMNFRWLFTVLMVAMTLLWSLVFLAGRRDEAAAPLTVARKWARALALAASACLAIGAVSIMDRRAPSQVWNAEKNLMYDYASDRLDAWVPHADAAADPALSFDQPVHPLAEAIGRRRPEFAGIPAFKNVVIIMMESIRWEGLDLDKASSSRAPALHAMARDGLLTKCYVSVPHSEKSEYAILTGRHPFPGFALKESHAARQPSILWALREQSGSHAFCFSTASLWFENTRGVLASCGADPVLSIPDITNGGQPTSPRTPYGLYDTPLVTKFAATAAETGTPFAAAVVTHAAHYPYIYPGKQHVPDISIDSYWASVKYLDSVMEEMVASFRAANLLDQTLFVFVGDHGESFGEHGTYIHNNNMYEEEIAVPLLFWSADGRLRNKTSQTVERSRQIDIAPTVADLMGIRDAAWPVQGVSIVGRNPRDTVYCASFFTGISRCVIKGSRKWVYFGGTARPVAYDLTTDPGEKHGLSLSDEEAAAAKRELDAFEKYERSMFGR